MGQNNHQINLELSLVKKVKVQPKLLSPTENSAPERLISSSTTSH